MCLSYRPLLTQFSSSHQKDPSTNKGMGSKPLWFSKHMYSGGNIFSNRIVGLSSFLITDVFCDSRHFIVSRSDSPLINETLFNVIHSNSIRPTVTVHIFLSKGATQKQPLGCCIIL